MRKLSLSLVLLILFISTGHGQDSTWIRLRPKYDQVSSIHRMFFGENYRKEWSDSTYLPLIDIAKVDGGLKPLQLGGGHQTVSLRLVSASGKEWVLRNIEKDPSVLLPEEIRQTFAHGLIDDAMSAQHPFSPLVVTEIAKAVNVPQASPVIGVVSPSPLLGEFSPKFAGKVCLLEEREPLGDSDNSLKMMGELNEDNDNTIDGEAFLRARILDMLIGDWDRHPDQWRWLDTRDGKSKYYVGIPRDRDQAFYVNQGLFPRLVSRPWFVPSLQGFRGEIWFPKYSMKESSFLQSRPAMHMPYEKWMEVAKNFTAALTDDVLRDAVKKLPPAAYERRHEELFRALQQRRDNIPAAVDKYYHFANRIVDLQLSDKHELVRISDSADGMLKLDVLKIGKQGVSNVILSSSYDPSITKELTVYTQNGNDKVEIDVKSSPIKIRIVGGEGEKQYNILSANKRISLYEEDDSIAITGNGKKLRKFISPDSLNTAYTFPNRYNITQPLVTAGFNRDDGFLLGLGIQHTHQGFRKVPYASRNKIMLHHSFGTGAYRIRYGGEFLHVFGKTDIVTQVDVFAPHNTRNFFGRGNESVFVKNGNSITFYRARYNLYTVSAGLRWRNPNGLSVVLAPTYQHYSIDSSDNRSRLLGTPLLTNSYDSATLYERRSHAGLAFNVGLYKVKGQIIPRAGYKLSLNFQALGGLNNVSENFAQIIPEVAGYLPLNKKQTIVLADRFGGGISLGKPAFYQSVFLGGHENLLGFRQYRFAGEHMLYNNLELRMKLTNFTGYIIPGEFGLVGFYDAGRVWVKDEDSKIWHHGTGAGLYFAPARLAVFSLVAGYSKEGWYPYITFGFRY